MSTIVSVSGGLGSAYALQLCLDSGCAIDAVSLEAIEEAPKRYLSLGEALKLEEEIYSNLKADKERARLAEAEYWKFLDDTIVED